MSDDYECTFSYVLDAIADDGLSYAFLYGDDFAKVKDEKFQELRKAFVDIAFELEHYVEDKAKEERSFYEY